MSVVALQKGPRSASIDAIELSMLDEQPNFTLQEESVVTKPSEEDLIGKSGENACGGGRAN